MAKALVNVKLKPKVGGLVSETYRDGTKHEGATCSLLTVFEGKDGKPPWVSLAPDIKTALKKGGFKIDDFFVNVYFEGKSNAKRQVAAADADDIFGDESNAKRQVAAADARQVAAADARQVAAADANAIFGDDK